MPFVLAKVPSRLPCFLQQTRIYTLEVSCFCNNANSKGHRPTGMCQMMHVIIAKC